MASTISPPSLLDNQKLDIESVKALVSTINQHMHFTLQDREAQRQLKVKCSSKLKIQSQEFFEFSEHSVLSNLYWGMDSTEAAAEAKSVEERAIKLENSEKLLQIPASLDENGSTLGIPNSYLVCSSYFYLAIVEMLRENEWQVAVHFLQAVSVSPRIVCTEFAPGICQSVYPLFIRHRVGKSFGSRRMKSGSEFDDGMIGEMMKWMAKRYKPWLMYYQIMSSQDELSKDRAHKSTENVGENSFPVFGNQLKIDSSSKIKCLKDILTESQPDTPVALHSRRASSENCAEDAITSLRSGRINTEALNQYSSLSWSSKGVKEVKAMECISRSFSTSFCDTDMSLAKMDHYTTLDTCIDEEDKPQRLHSIRSVSLRNYQFSRQLHHKASTMMKKNYSCRIPFQPEDSFFLEQGGVLEKIISKLCFTEELSEDCTVEMKTIYEMLSSKSGLKYSLLKDIILDQLLVAISTSREERVVRISVAILSTIVTENRAVLEDVKRKGLQLCDLATALKRNVHEAVILIYLINPSPAEMKPLELLPCLVEVVCTSNTSSYKLELTASLLLTPPAASLMIMEVLVTAFDYETNRMHLSVISSPRVLSGLLQVPRQDNLEEFISLAAILVKCMQFDGKCRKYISESSPVNSFVSLLWSNHKRATYTALEFFNELHKTPRSTSVRLLEQIHNQGSVNNMCALFLLTQNTESEYKLLAANLLLQLEVLENTSAKCIYREEAAEAILESLTCEECPAAQAMAAFILSNIGGTYSWNGEPYTVPWLVKKIGLTSACHRNLIKNYDFLDQSLQDSGIDSWSSKMAQRILHIGTPVFHALSKGLKSKVKRVSRDCLVATAWLGRELVKGPDELRQEACEILLHDIEQYVHPGFDLEERLLATLCIFNYTSGRGMKKIMNLSEGVRESLRRLSNVTWMAEELLKVADYFQPNKWRISCVHSQMLEAGNKSNGAVTALVYYKGHLFSGYVDGSIKVWDLKGQTATLVHETKEHRKAVTSFALYEPGNCLLSGSADKTIKIWQMLQRKIECIEVILMKESIKSIDSSGELIFATTQTNKLKVIDGSRKAKDVFKNKRVKCVKIAQGKVYGGCTDSSIQELMIVNNRHQEIKAASKSWMQNKSINSVSIYKDWLYSAGSILEGSKIKDWRRGCMPQISIIPEKGASVLAMEVVEDFIYLNCSTSMSSLQIWLRGTQHKVGRLSAGSKITCFFTANDMILCGTEKGVIKGWIPL